KEENEIMVQDTTNLLAPATGAVIALAKTSDPIFSQGTMGDGFGLTPTIGKVVAPVSGKISMVADTKHAVGIVTEGVVEVLVHMSMYTVDLKEAILIIKIENDQEVKAGK